MCECMLGGFSHVKLFVILWAVAPQAPLFMGFSRQEYWGVLSCPSPGDLPTQGLNWHLFGLLHWLVGSLPLMSPGKKYREVPSNSQILVYHYVTNSVLDPGNIAMNTTIYM